MVLAYGTAIGAGMLVLLLLALSFLLLTMLAGGLAHAFVSDPAGFAKRLSLGTVLITILCVIPILLALNVNPQLFTSSSSRIFALLFLVPPIPLGCVIGVFVCILRSRR